MAKKPPLVLPGIDDQSFVAKFHECYTPVTECGCWLWDLHWYRGYGKLRFGGKKRAAHRLSWAIHFGPVPEGLEVLHKCDMPMCVNPYHLFVGTNSENLSDKMTKERQARGEKVNTAKLTAENVEFIRNSHQKYTTGELADMFGVLPTSIRKIIVGTNWKHIDGPKEKTRIPPKYICNGQSRTLSEWADSYNVTKRTFIWRVARHWILEEAEYSIYRVVGMSQRTYRGKPVEHLPLTVKQQEDL